MAQHLLNIQQDFITIVDNIQPWILSHFVMWLDMKVAEFKVYGYMILDPETSSSSPQCGRSTDLTSMDSNSSDIQDICIVPKFPSQKKVHSTISRKQTPEHGGHIRNLNKLFIQKYDHQHSAAKLKDGIESSPGYTNRLNTDHVRTHTSSVSQDRHCKESNSSPSTSRTPDTVVAVHHDPNKLKGGVSIISFCEERYSPEPTSLKTLANVQNMEQDNYPVDKMFETVSDGESLYISNVTSLSVSETSQHSLQSEGLPALYKNQQFNRLITDSQKRNSKLWDSSEAMVGDTVNSNADSHQADSTGQVDKQTSFESVAASNSNDFFQDSNDNSNNTVHVSQMNQSSPIVVKIEDDSDEDSLMIENDNQSHSGSNQSRDQTCGVKETPMDKEVLALFSGSGSGTAVPVDLVAHSDLQNFSTVMPGTAGSGTEADDNSPEKTGSVYNIKSPRSLLYRDPTTGRFRCELCSVTFRNRSSYFRHKRLHGEKRYCCFVCKKRFHRKEHVQLHMNRHGRCEELVCPICSFLGSDCVSMETHFRSVHNITYMFSYGLDILSATNC